MKNHFFLLAFLFIPFFSCDTDSAKQSDKSKPTTFVTYYLRYMETEHQLQADATYASGDSLQVAKPIAIDKGVFFHGGNMNERNLGKRGIRYSAMRDGSFSDDYLFRYNDPLHGKTDHHFHMNSCEKFSIKNNISKTNGMIVNWDGEPLQADENLVFLFKNEKNKLTTFEVSGATTTPEIFVPAQKLKPLEEGEAELYLVRKQATTTQQPNLVVMAEMEYYTHVIKVTILP